MSRQPLRGQDNSTQAQTADYIRNKKAIKSTATR